MIELVRFISTPLQSISSKLTVFAYFEASSAAPLNSCVCVFKAAIFANKFFELPPMLPSESAESCSAIALADDIFNWNVSFVLS